MVCDKSRLALRNVSLFPFVKTWGVLLSSILVMLFADASANDHKLSRREYEELMARPDFQPLRFGGHVDDFSPDRGNGRRERRMDGPAGALYFRLRLDQIVADSSKSYGLSILDLRSGSVIQTIGAPELATMPSLLSTPLYFPKVVIRVDGADQSLSFTVSHLLVPRLDPQIRPEALAPGFTLYSEMPWDDPLLKSAISVAKLHIGLKGFVCTGFLIGNGALLTNFHCLEGSEQYQKTRGQPQPQCGDIWAQFDYQRPNSVVSGSLPTCQQVLVSGRYPHGTVSQDEGDFALLRFDPDLLRRPATGEARPVLGVATTSINTNQRVQMIQHPWGWPLHFALGCILQPTLDRPFVVQHNCSTLPGSSGSPILTEQGLVIALHHTPSRITPQAWRNLEEGEDPAAVSAKNEGTPISMIWPKLEPFLR